MADPLWFDEAFRLPVGRWTLTGGVRETRSWRYGSALEVEELFRARELNGVDGDGGVEWAVTRRLRPVTIWDLRTLSGRVHEVGRYPSLGLTAKMRQPPHLFSKPPAVRLKAPSAPAGPVFWLGALADMP